MYPFMINITDKRVVVIGGGKVAAKRVHSLLPWQPLITVVSPTLDPSLRALVNEQRICHKARFFKSSDVARAFIVIAATNDANINRIVRDSCDLNQLVNIVDEPLGSSFHFPAVYEKDKLTVAVSTNGVSPSLAIKLRDEFAAVIDDFEPDYIGFLKEVRASIKHSNLTAEEKRELLKQVLDDAYRYDIEARMQLKEKLFEVIR